MVVTLVLARLNGESASYIYFVTCFDPVVFVPPPLKLSLVEAPPSTRSKPRPPPVEAPPPHQEKFSSLSHHVALTRCSRFLVGSEVMKVCTPVNIKQLHHKKMDRY